VTPINVISGGGDIKIEDNLDQDDFDDNLSPSKIDDFDSIEHDFSNKDKLKK
jgi:hypothetical protein